MPTYPRLKIPSTNRIKIFRSIDDHFRADPQIRATVKVFQSWTGKGDDKTPASIDQTPWARLSILGSPQQYWASSTLLGTLIVQVDLAVGGYCLDDIDNLWGLFERSCYPADRTAALAWQAKLRSVGAHTGLITFSQPAIDRDPCEGALSGSGQLAIDYRFDTHPQSPGL